ncbi:MAG: PAS domain S-box protein [Ignavibacteriales bacterium]|nr:PAS domain S-box protein [Ignavibacteriales bacterium]
MSNNRENEKQKLENANKKINLLQNELKETEFQFNEITSVVAEGIFVVDADKKLKFANPEFFKLLGYNSEEIINTDIVNKIYSHENKIEKNCPIDRVFDNGETVRVSYDYFQTNDDVYLPVSFVASPILRDGKIIGCVTAFHDITELIQNEEEIKRFVEELQFNKELMEENVTEAARLNEMLWNSEALIKKKMNELSASEAQLKNEIEIYKNEIIKNLEENHGYIYVNISNEYKGYFQDLLRGFEDFAKLKGYNLSFSIDNTIFDKIAFKFCVHEYSNEFNQKYLRTDLIEYLHCVLNGEDFNKVPEILGLNENKFIIDRLSDRIKFLNSNLNNYKLLNEQYEKLLNTISNTDKGLYNIQNLNITFNKDYQVINNKIEDSSNVNLKNKLSKVYNDPKLIRNFNKIINELIEKLNNEKSENKNELIKELSKIKSEIGENKTISTKQNGSFKDRIKNLLQYVEIGSEIYKYLEKLLALLKNVI